MLCEKCQKRPAAVHMTKIVNGNKTETHLCEVCAQVDNSVSFGLDPKWMLQSIFAELFNMPHTENDPSNAAGVTTHRCEKCGFTDAQFSQVGRLGCPKCYDVFENKLDPVLRRIHGNPRHTGKIPKRTGGTIELRREIEELKQELQAAITSEKYEKAAEVRDKIRGLENKLG